MRPLILALLLVGSQAFAAISSSIVLEVRTTGSDTNSGGYKTGSTGTDWSQQAAAQYSVTDAVDNGTTTITSATANFGTDVVGNLVYFQGGTGGVVAQWREIISRTNATTIVVDVLVAPAGTGMTLKIGGALASPGQAATIASNLGIDIYIKAGTYNITSAGANVATGRAQFSGSVSNTCYVEGYNSTRGDLGTKPVMFATTITTGAMAESVGYVTFRNIEVDSQSKASVTPFASTSKTHYDQCLARNGAGTGFSIGTADRCRAISCATGFSLGTAFACVTESCTTVGFASGTNCFRCIDNASTKGFILNTDGQMLVDCVAYGGSGTGYDFSTAGNMMAINSVAVNRTGKGFTGITNPNVRLISCAGYNNSTGNHDATDTRATINFITLSGDPFTAAGSGDFSLNSTAGAGAALRATGVPVAFPNATTTTAVNVGATENSGVAAAGGGAFTYSN